MRKERGQHLWPQVSGGGRENSGGSSPPRHLQAPAPKEIRPLLPFRPPPPPRTDAGRCSCRPTSRILLFLPPRCTKFAHLEAPGPPNPTPDMCMSPKRPRQVPPVATSPHVHDKPSPSSSPHPPPAWPAQPAAPWARSGLRAGAARAGERGQGRAGRPELTMAKPESRAEVRLEALSLARLK